MNDLTALDTSTASDWVRNNDGIILFHKKLCPHCKVMRTVLDKARAQEPALKLATLDTEEQPGLLPEFGVERTPTLLVCKGGEVKAKQTGLMNPAQLLAFYWKA